MLLSRVLCVVTLLGPSFAEINLSRILAEIPACTQECSVKVLGDAQCPLPNVADCLCPNATLQKTLATCVLGACNVTEQHVTTSIFQEEVCKGSPRESRSNEIIVVSIVLAAITYPVVVLRFVSRWVVAHKIWWDDWCILITTLFLIPLSVLPIFNASQGFGIHFWDVPAENIVHLRQTYFVTQILYVIVLILSKISILCLYLRIFINPGFERVIKILIGVLTCRGTIYLFCVAFQCTPISSIWTMQPAKCLDASAIVYTGAALSIFEDFATMLLPIWELKKLNLGTRRKVALGFMFALGSFASVTSIIRLRFIAKFGNSFDVTWDNVDVIIWSEIEIFTAVICACLICIRPLFVKLLPSFLRNNHVTETIPKLSRQSRSQRWSKAFSSRLPRDNNGGVMMSGHSGEAKLKLVDSHKEEAGKVWVTHSASVESRSIHLDERTASRDTLTHYYKPTTMVEADPMGVRPESSRGSQSS